VALVLAVLIAPAGVNFSSANGTHQQAPSSAQVSDTVGSHSVVVKLPPPSVSKTAFPPRRADALYSAGEYPMGLADYGQAHYNSSSFLATASITSLSTSGSGSVGSDMGFQLNVVLEFESGGTYYEYWIQNIAWVDTAAQEVQSFENNIWNFSSSSMCLSNSAISGNGAVNPYSGCEGYYAYGVGASFTYPGTFQLIVNTSVNSNGQPTVRFMYDTGSGFVTYDLVRFAFVTQLDESYSFVVNSGATTPAGTNYDAEFVLGGPGGGTSTADESSDLQLTLQSWNGNNYQMIQNGENHGEDTGETITNAEVNGYYYTSTGQLYAGVIAGTENIDQLWGSTTVAFVNLQGPGTCDGTLLSGSSGTPFIGGNASITLWPVSPDFQVSCDGFTLDLGSDTLSAGSTLDLVAGTWANLDFGQSGLSGAATWSVKIGSDAQAGSGATLSFYVPVGSYQYTVSGPAHYLPQPSAGGLTLSSAGAGVSVTWQDVVISTNSTTGSVDLGQVVEFSSSLTGTTGDSVAWGGLPTGCAGADSLSVSCDPTRNGDSSLTLTITDTNGYSAESAAVSFAVYTDPSISAPAIPATSSDVGRPATLATIVSPGSGGDSFTWTGLPAGCSSGNASTLTCAPSEKGTYPIEITLTDSNDYTVRATESLVVYPLPTVDSFAASPGSSILAGQSFTFTAVPGNGSGGFHYLWNSLPAGCQSTDSYSLSCTPSGPGNWNVSVTVTDSNGGNATSHGLAVAVQPSFLGLPALEGYGLFIVLPIVVAAVLIAILVVRRRRGNPGNSPRFTEEVQPILGPSGSAGPAPVNAVPAGALLIQSQSVEPSSATEGLEPGSVVGGAPLISPPDPACWHCQFENPPASLYCSRCGLPLEPPPNA
jgi:hypothetical protein